MGEVDDGEFRCFLEAEWPRVLAVAVAMVGDLGVGEDLCQDAFIDAHRRWGRVSGLDRPGAWVRRAVLNRAASVLRRREMERRALGILGRRPDPPDTELPLEPGDHELWGEVRRLPTRQARCVVLRHVDGLSVREIAEMLGCAEPTVRVHLHRGLTTLRQRLGSTAALEPGLETS